jgi:hypothetical protein
VHNVDLSDKYSYVRRSKFNAHLVPIDRSDLDAQTDPSALSTAQRLPVAQRSITSRRCMRILLRMMVIAVVSAMMAGCDENLSDLTGPTPNLQPTFGSIQSEIFEATDSSGRSACTSCHTNVGRIPAGGLNLNHDAAYSQLIDMPTRPPVNKIRVTPGDPDSSYLIHKLEGRSDINGRRMPNNGPPYLTDGQIQVIRRWIEIGAPNN